MLYTRTCQFVCRGRALRVFIGLFVGFGSALTGSSGPVLLLPLLLILRWPVFEALGYVRVGTCMRVPLNGTV